jgi:NADPH2:quinone reductase
MKAILCREFGPIEKLTYEDVPSPVPAAGQVTIRVAAAGVNFPDALMVEGKYQHKPPFPFSPGGEVAGTIKSLGAGVEGLQAGDDVIGIAMHGAYAEEIVVDARGVIPIPRGTDPAKAAALMFAHGTSLHALQDRAALKSGESLLVLGAAGGVGLAAVELGKAMGARVIAAASSAEKLDVCRARGADETINYTSEDLRDRLRTITEGRGVDVVYDAVGGPHSEPAFRSIAWNGRFLVVGFAAGAIPQIALNLPLLKGASIVGVFWGEFMKREPARHRANARQLLDWLAAGKIAPHIHARYPLSRAVDALAAVRARQVTGKIVLVPEG